MSLQSERLQLLMQRLGLTEMVHGYQALSEQAAQKNLPYCDFLEQVLESEANVRQERNIKVRTQLASFQTSSGWSSWRRWRAGFRGWSTPSRSRPAANCG